MRDNRFLKRLRKKAKKGLRGWPLATIAFYGPNLSQATKAAVGIIPSENAEAEEMRAWHGVVPCLRVLAWTRSFYGTDACLNKMVSGRTVLVRTLRQRSARF
jgi:hypothetical protein